MERTVLITGCSSGIGRATAATFLEAGWEVYATARDPADVSDLDEHGCRTAALDVTDDEAVRRVVDRVFDEQAHLDCLVNNAGYGQFGPIEDVPMDRIITQFDVNTFGPLRLFRAVLPRMRERGEGTIVNVTAGFGGLTAPGLGAYTASKFALESAIDALRQEASRFGVDVVMIEPGLVATGFYDRVRSEVDAIEHTAAYADLYRVLGSVGVVENGGPGINGPDRAADTILRAASAPRPDPVYRVGALATLGTATASVVRGRVRDRAARAGVRAIGSTPVQRFLNRDRGDSP